MRVKERLKRYLAMLLAIAMLMTSSSMGVLAEGMNAEPEIMTTAETQPETPAPETQPETPAPETQPAPTAETQPETPAPETQPATAVETQPETPAPETQPATAVETQPETPAPETQPATTAETAAPETQPATTEAVTDTEKASETQKPADTEKVTEAKAEETEVRKNLVTFITGGTSYITVDGKRIQDNRANALDGVIKFKVIVNDGYHLENVIVDGTTELTPENGIYTIHGIQTDATIVEIKTAENPQTEAESETELQTEELTETESETETETELQEEAEKPQQTLITTAGGATIIVSAPAGALPEGAYVTAVTANSAAVKNAVEEAVEAEGKELVSSQAYDITIYSAEGNEIQPDKSVRVTITGTGLSGDGSVYHVSGNTAEKVGDVPSAQTAVFSGDHFSIYVVTETTGPALTTYEFISEGKTLDEYTQIVKTGDVLKQPASPESEGKKFLGWNTKEDGTGSYFTDFNSALTITATETVRLYASFENVHYVYFMDDKGRVYTTKEGKTGDTIAADVKFQVAANYGISGWYTDAALTGSPVTDVTIGNENITLYPKVELGYWITYASEGGSYLAPQFVTPGTSTVKPADPTRAGYEFRHWSLAQKGEAYTFGSSLTDNITLYAVWQGKTNTKYTVICWTQNADDDEFSYHSAYTAAGTSGAMTTESAKSMLGFKAQPIVQMMIKGDGSTILNVYYDRNSYEIKFYKYQRGTFFQPGQWVEITENRISARYGAFIKDKWPESERTWAVSPDGNIYQCGIETMPLNGAAFYRANLDGKYTIESRYYLEGLDGKYVLDHKDSLKSNDTDWNTTENDHYDINGFTYTNNTKDGTAYKRDGKTSTYYADFRYSRNSYSIKFYNNGNLDKTVAKKFEANISDADYTPQRPAGISSDYTFEGWYDNELCAGNPYVFTGKNMPANNITLYAKWAAPVYNCYYYVTIDGSDGGTLLQVRKGNKISEEDLPVITVPENYVWIGWSTRNKLGEEYVYTPFNFDSEIHSAVHLYPYYISNEKLTVTYDPNGGSGTVPTDQKKYAQGSYAEVAAAAGLTMEGKAFLGWSETQVGSGKLYQPKDKVLVKENVVLYAQWGDKAAKVKLTYHSNYPAGTDSVKTITELKNNGTVEVLSLTGCEFAAVAGYRFAGWNTKADGTGMHYGVAQMINVDNNHSNELYAQWMKVHTVEFLAGEHGSLNGTTRYEDIEDGKGWNDIKIPTPKPEDGYQFDAWYENGQKVTDWPQQITSDHTYTAQFTKRTDLTYTVKYLEKDTGDVLHEEKAVTDQTFGTVVKAENQIIEINGYRFDSADPTEMTVGTGENVMILYYAADFTNIEVRGINKEYDGQTSAVTVSGTEARDVIKYFNAVGNEIDNAFTDVADSGDVTVKIARGSSEKELTAKVSIRKREVTITADDKSKIYGEVDPAFTGSITPGSLVKADDLGTITYKRTNADEDVGTYPAVLDVQYTENANYTVTIQKGTFTIAKAGANTVNITGTSVTYDGAEHGLEAVKAEKEGSILYFRIGDDGEWTIVEPKFTDAGSYEVQVYAENPNYEDTEVVKGTVTIAKRPLTIKADDHENFIYDGTVHRAEGYTADNLVDGEKISGIKAGGEGKEVGTYTTTVTDQAQLKIEKADETDSTRNYDVSYADGSFEIVPAKIETYVTLTPTDVEAVYDGNIHRAGVASAVSSTGDTKLKIEYSKDGGTIWTEDPTTITAINVEDGIAAVKVRVSGDNYDGVVEDTEKLIITKREVTITADDTSKIYGEVDPAFTGRITTGSLVKAGDLGTITYKRTNADEDVGTYPAVLDVQYTENANYTVTIQKGTFTIAKAGANTVNITGTSVTYDGAEHGLEAVKAEKEGSILYFRIGDDGKWTIVEPKFTDAGSYEVQVYAKNPNYEDTEVVKGTVTIAKRPLTIKADDHENFIYDGTVHKAEGYTADNLVDGEKISGIKAGGEGKEVGTYTTTVTDQAQLKIEKADETDSTRNYDVSYADGSFEIVPAKIETYVTLTPTDVEAVYDGNIHRAGVASAVSSTGDTKLKIEYSKDGGTIWTEDPTTITAINVEDGIAAVKVRVSGDNYDGVVEDTEKLIITKREVTITADDTSKIYGEVDPAFTGRITTGSLVKAGDLGTITYKRTNADEDVGTYPAVLDVQYTENANYTVTIQKGTFTIAKAGANTVNITGTSVIYDGAEHGLEAVKAEKEGSILYFRIGDDGKWTIVEPKFTDAGSYEVQVYAKNPNYEDTEVVKGTVTIAKRPLTIKADDHENFIYDGTVHKAEGYTADNLVDGEKISGIKAGGEGKEVGTYTTTVTDQAQLKIEKADETDSTRNYDVSYADGSFEIVPAKIETYVTLTPTDVEAVYDGYIHRAGVASAVSSTGDTKLKIEYSKDGGTAWTEDPTTITAINVEDSIEAVKVRVSGDNYDGYMEATEKLVITHRPLTITGEGFEKEQPYTGSEYRKDTFTVESAGAESGLVDGQFVEGLTYELKGTLVGKYTGSFEVSALSIVEDMPSPLSLAEDPAGKARMPQKRAVDLKDNYKINLVPGNLTIVGDPVEPEKTTPPVREVYKLGDKIPFTITVKNISNEELRDIEVEDLNAIVTAGTGYTVTGDHTVLISTLASEASVMIFAEHVVTPEDILAGTVENTATVKAGDKTFTVTAETRDIEEIDPKLDVDKTSDVKDGEKAALNQTITYKIKVTNAGNVTYKNVVVTEQEGMTITAGEGYTVNADGTAVIRELPVGTSVEVTAAHVVTETDILAGKVANRVTVKGDKIPDPKNPGESKTPEGEDTKEDPAEDKSSELTISKEITNADAAVDGKYPIGETIRYEIRIRNSGNLSLTNVTAEDVLTANEGAPAGTVVLTAGEGYTVTGTVITIEKLAPGEEMVIPAAYVVQEEDAGKTLVNVATGKADTPDTDVKDLIDDSSEPVPAVIEDPVIPDENTEIGKITVRKSVTKNGKASPVNDTIYVALFNEDGEIAEGTKPQAISLANASDGETTFKNLPSEDVTYKVVEVNKKGEPAAAGKDGFKYSRILYSGQEVTLTMDKASAKVSIENQLPAEAAVPKQGAARTGDDTNTLMYWIILAMAAVAMSGSFAYRKKRKIR